MYQDFFLSTKRLTSTKEIAIVRSTAFESLLTTLVADPNINPLYKALFAICLSGGLRISECLNLKKEAFFEDNGMLFFKVQVLKKRRSEVRWCRVHPLAENLVRSQIASKIGKVFKWTSRTCLRKIQMTFNVPGICNHSLRHSAVSYYLFQEKRTREETAKLVHVSSTIIDHYAHLDERSVLREMFQKK